MKATFFIYSNRIRYFLTKSSTSLKWAVESKERSMAMIRILLSTELGKRRWSQADLARMTGIRASTIGDYYNELTDRINLRHFELICKALDCDRTDILVYHPDEDTPVKSRSGAPLHEQPPKE